MAKTFGIHSDLKFEETKDGSGEIKVEIEGREDWLTENDAIGIIEHLKKVFGI